MKKVYDIAIVGNGILGLTLAYFLKEQDNGLKIALIGPKNRPGCATLAAGAMINVWSELTNGQFENEALKDRFALTRKGGQAWRDLSVDLSQRTGKDVRIKWGTYLIRTSKSTSIENNTFRYIKKALKDEGINHSERNPEDLPWLKPSQGAIVTETLWIEDDGFVDVREIISSLDKVLDQDETIDIIDGKALKLTSNKSLFSRKTSHTVSVSDGTEIEAEQVVLANGAFAQDLIDQHSDLAGKSPRLLFGIGSGIDITFPQWVHKYGGLGKEIFDLDGVIRTPDRGGACGVHVVPYGNGCFYAGASSLTSLDADELPKAHGVHVLLHSLLTEINRSFFHAGISFRGNGFRPTTIDCFPLIGESNVPGIWLLNGTKRDGFTMSAHLSSEFAKAITGKDNALPKRFTPCRSPISYKNKEMALKDAEFMYIGADAQHGGVQAPYMIDKYLEMRRAEVLKVYEKRNIDSFGIHPEVLHLYDNDEFYEKVSTPKIQKAA